MTSFAKLLFLAAIGACYVKAEYYGEHEVQGHDLGGHELGGHDLSSYSINHIEHDGGEHHEHHIDYYKHPKYQFNYAVHDPHTGDEKQHYEERDGDQVKGSYSLKEADGTTRVVNYKADKHNGFQAEVHKIGHPKIEHHDIHGYEGHY